MAASAQGLDDNQAGAQTEPAQSKVPNSCKFGCGYLGKGQDNLQKGRDLSTHYRKEHKEEMKKQARTKVEDEIRTKDEDIYANIKLRGKEALHEVMRTRLEDLLSAPGVAEQSKEYALSEWDSDPAIRDNLNQLARVLTDDAGIKPDRALRIVEKLYYLIEPFLPALNATGDRPPIFFGGNLRDRAPPRRGYGDYPSRDYDSRYPDRYSDRYPRWDEPYYDNYGPRYDPRDPRGYDRPITREEMSRTVEDVVKKVIDANKPKTENNVTLMEPLLDADGDPIIDQNTMQPVTIPLVLPASVAMSYLVNKRSVGTSKAQGALPPEVKIQFDKMSEDLKESRKETAGVLKKLEDKDREDMLKRATSAEEAAKEAKVEAQKAREEAKIASSSKVVEGYQNDSYRLIGQGVDKLGGALDKIASKWDGPGSGLQKILGPGNRPMATAQEEAEAPSLITEEMKKRGLN